MTNLQNLIDKALQEKQDKRKDRVRSGTFSPSSFGKCFRAQIWKRQNKPESNPPDIKSLRKMHLGVQTHNLTQNLLPEEMVEVRVEEDDVLGFCDISSDKAYDIKSSDAYLVKNYWNIPTYIAIKDKYESFLQVAYYGRVLGKEKASILPCVFGQFPTELEHEIIIKEWEDDLDCELYILRSYWEQGIIPEPEPRAYGGRECSYCGFADVCRGVKDE